MKNESTGPGLAASLPVRDATPADLDGLVEFENLCFDIDRISRRSFRDLIDVPTAACRVAVRAGRIVGYALLLFRTGSNVARLYSLAVDPGYRGTGLGALFIKDAEACAVARGRATLRLEVREDNADAVRLYQRLGYRGIGRRPEYYADKTGALRFEKRLRDYETPASADGLRGATLLRKR